MVPPSPVQACPEGGPWAGQVATEGNFTVNRPNLREAEQLRA